MGSLPIWSLTPFFPLSFPFFLRSLSARAVSAFVDTAIQHTEHGHTIERSNPQEWRE
jgi:hypothetical protein